MFKAIIVNRPAKTKVKETFTMKNGTITGKSQIEHQCTIRKGFLISKLPRVLKSRIKFPRAYQQIKLMLPSVNEDALPSSIDHIDNLFESLMCFQRKNKAKWKIERRGGGLF